jgi:hypothetical protein
MKLHLSILCAVFFMCIYTDELMSLPTSGNFNKNSLYQELDDIQSQSDSIKIEFFGNSDSIFFLNYSCELHNLVLSKTIIANILDTPSEGLELKVIVDLWADGMPEYEF